MLNCHC